MTDINWDCYLDPPHDEIDWDTYEEIEIDGHYYIILKQEEIDTSFIDEEDEAIKDLIKKEPKNYKGEQR